MDSRMLNTYSHTLKKKELDFGGGLVVAVVEDLRIVIFKMRSRIPQMLYTRMNSGSLSVLALI